MNRIYRCHCCLFDFLLSFQSDDLIARYGDEMRLLFGDALSDAWQEGPSSILRVWSAVLAETIVLTAPRYAGRLRLVLAASFLACVMTGGTLLGFCSIGSSPIVHACSEEQDGSQVSAHNDISSGLIQLPNGHRMFLECSGDANAKPTVILANGRGLGTADSWALVQQKLPSSIRVCSYDAIGAGQSDKVQESHPELRPIDQVILEMHALFQTGRLNLPYVLVGASAGGVLVAGISRIIRTRSLDWYSLTHRMRRWNRVMPLSRSSLIPIGIIPSFYKRMGFFRINKSSHGMRIYPSSCSNAQRKLHFLLFQG